MVWSLQRVLVLLAAALCLIAGISPWHTWVPTLADGSSCAARVYSYGPGGGVSSGSGERAPAEVDAGNVRCRDAAWPAWWEGTTLLVLGALS